MGRKAAKATRKFAASGQLKKTIQQRRKHQDVKRKAERRQHSRKGKEKQVADEDEHEALGEEYEHGVSITNQKYVLFPASVSFAH